MKKKKKEEEEGVKDNEKQSYLWIDQLVAFAFIWRCQPY